jgi:glutamine kinase
MRVTSFEFGTKAETLAALQGCLKHSRLLPQYFFSCKQWIESRDKVLTAIDERFSGQRLAVRSSAQGEDGEGSSMAGAYDSVLDVNASDRESLIRAVQTVMDSYSGNPEDQILVQPLLASVALSGVVMTHDIETGAPYYVVSYDDESGRTDTVTAGNGVNKTVLLHREYEPELIESNRIRAILHGVHELEQVCGNVPLDIEFVLTSGRELFILQVRRIALHKTWHPVTERRTSRKLAFIEHFIKQRSAPRNNLLGDRTVLGVMTDWNPAEIIGVTPRPLAVSLYRELVTARIWRDARTAMGYRCLPAEELMVVIDHHPYIDVRNSFNSFLPATLPDDIGEKLINAWLEKLNARPELHDKVEFEIAHTCLDVDFDDGFITRYPELLTDTERAIYRDALQNLTNTLLDYSESGNLKQSMARVKQLALYQEKRSKSDLEQTEDPLQLAIELLDECRDLGTFPFACLARHGFIAEVLLRSLVRVGAIASDRVAELKHAIHTITSDLVADFQAATNEPALIPDFLRKYGHLRPGTYDITSLRYDECPDLFSCRGLTQTRQKQSRFEFSTAERRAITDSLASAGLNISATELFAYVEAAVKGRELGKFVFTRNLSDALYCLSRWGEMNGLSREDVSYLDWEKVKSSAICPVLDYQDRYFLDLATEAEKSLRAALPLRLGYLLRDARDVFVIPVNRHEPTFITNESVVGETVLLDAKSSAAQSLFNKIVCIKHADPGFDWIFTKGIRGLITQFGGANSHMAIRCAEFGIPAAIGCGEQTFKRMTRAESVLLNCHNRILQARHHG